MKIKIIFNLIWHFAIASIILNVAVAVDFENKFSKVSTKKHLKRDIVHNNRIHTNINNVKSVVVVHDKRSIIKSLTDVYNVTRVPYAMFVIYNDGMIVMTCHISCQIIYKLINYYFFSYNFYLVSLNLISTRGTNTKNELRKTTEFHYFWLFL